MSLPSSFSPSSSPPAPSALSILQTVFGYQAFRGQQEEIIQHVTAGNDALVLMPTGGGKSLCYQIPALLRQGVTVVVSPLIALMQDQVDALQQLGVRAAVLNSTVAWEQVREIECLLFSHEIDLVYVAPERLTNERTLSLLDSLFEQNLLGLFAIDEAHCVSQWGHDFRPEYLQLNALHERYPSIPRIALTATADDVTRQEIIYRLGLNTAKVFLSSFDRPNIRYLVAEKDNPRRQLQHFLQEHQSEAGIIYCASRRKVEETSLHLCQEGYVALPYHAGLSPEVRLANQRRFLYEEGVIMVATIAFGMGINKPDVRFVVHLDLPKSLEAYYQETGRAGRDGEPAVAWMVYGMQDFVLQQTRINESTSSDVQKQVERQKLQALFAYCETANCRRQALLTYFSEHYPQTCGNCDTCLDPPKLWDATIAAQKALSVVFRTKMRFGMAYLIDVLLGKPTQRISENQHQQLPTFGVGKELNEKQWRSVFRQLLAQGLLSSDLEAFNTLQLTEAARPVLRGESKVWLAQRLLKQGDAKARKGSADNTSMSLEMQILFNKLRMWRLQVAKEQEVPAYVILHDRALRLLCEQRPKTLAELVLIPGLGQAKVNRYGTDLLFLCHETI